MASPARIKKRLDRRAARLPVPPRQDPDGKLLYQQMLHLVRSSVCPDAMKLTVQTQVLAASIVLTSHLGSEQAHADQVLANLKSQVEGMAQRRANGGAL